MIPTIESDSAVGQKSLYHSSIEWLTFKRQKI